MDKQYSINTQLLQKTVSSSNDSQQVQAGSVVKLRTWVEGHENMAINGTYLLGNNELDGKIQNIVIEMKVGQIWKIKTVNKISSKQQILNIEVLSTEKANEQIESRKKDSANVRAQKFKKEGNSFVKDKKYEQAIECYQKAYKLIEYNCDNEAIEIRLSLLSNLALATLNTGRYQQCLQWCKNHINQSVQPNKKVIYREVSAYKGLKQWDKVKQKIQKALEMFKKDEQAIADFKGLREAAEKQHKIDMAKQKKVYSNMFG